MDKRILKIALMFVAAACISACSKDPLFLNNRYIGLDYADSDHEILVDASIECLPSSTKSDLIGVVNGTTFPTSTDKVFAITSYRSDDVPTSFTPNSRINDDVANTSAEGAVTFAKPKYYPEEGKLYFYAFSPVVHSNYYDGFMDTHSAVSWKLTGNEDIMWANYIVGISKSATMEEQRHPVLIFRHKLTQIQLKLIQGPNFPLNPKVDSLIITNAPDSCRLDLINGNIEWGADNGLTIKSSDMTIRTASSSTPFPVMIKPDIASVRLCFSIRGIEYETDIPLDPDKNQGKAGYATLIKLTFSGLKLNFTTELTDWVDVGFANGDI